MRRTTLWITLALVAFALMGLLSPGDSIPRARQRVLRQDLCTFRAVLNQYYEDKHVRAQTLQDLVVAGYVKQLPADPMTGQTDTWVVVFSTDPRTPGIVDVRSGCGVISSEGTPYREW